MTTQLDFFADYQVYKLDRETASKSETFLVPSYLVERCINWAHDLIVIGVDDQMKLTPMDLVLDTIPCDLPNHVKYKYECNLILPILDELDLMLIDRFNWSWFNLLKDYIRTDEFVDMISGINDLRDKSVSIEPSKNNVFRAFQETNADFVRIIFIGQDCYPAKGVANGIAFATDNNTKPFALREIEWAIKQNMNYPDEFVLKNDLSNWTKQNILMLNMALTVETNKIGSHLEYWKPFIQYVIKQLNTRVQMLCFVLLGKQAQSLSSMIDIKHMVKLREHPTAAYHNNRHWLYINLFSDINDFSLEHTKHSVHWI